MLFGTCGGGDGLEAFQTFLLIHAYKSDALGYCLAGRYQKTDPFLWNNDFEERNLAAAIDLDLPLAGQLTFGFKYANALTGGYPVQPQREKVLLQRYQRYIYGRMARVWLGDGVGLLLQKANSQMNVEKGTPKC